ncbi:MAG: hypothetical protein ACE5FU_10085 [Nitrospinota bacterium]
MTGVSVFLFLIALLLPGSNSEGAEPGLGKEREEKKIIVMKPKLVEGEVGKPAIIIIPRAGLLQQDPFDKSYHNDIIRDLHLDTMKDIEELKE